MPTLKGKFIRLLSFGCVPKRGNRMEEEQENIFYSGVVEGFYGRPWTFQQRKELFLRMQKLGMNTYMYAPKDDIKHRALWREPYTAEEELSLKNLIEASKECEVVFMYALSPGLDITFSNTKEIEALTQKMEQVSKLGCEAFALLFDDIDPELRPVDKTDFKSFAEAQVFVTNKVFETLKHPKFLFCPTEYCATRAVPNVEQSSYLRTIGSDLHPAIDILWTGPKVISKVITTHSIQCITKALKRRPVIWDNIHANDYDQRRIFLGPYDGRPIQLYPLIRGVLTNPNCEHETNFMAIHTMANWVTCAKKAHEEDKETTGKNHVADKQKDEDSVEPMEEDSNHAKTDKKSFEKDSENEEDKNGSDSSKTDPMETELDCKNSEVHKSKISLESRSIQLLEAYDPKRAVREAADEWIKEFFILKSTAAPTYAKSGSYYTLNGMSSSVNVMSPISTEPRTTSVLSTSPTTSPIKAAKEKSRSQQAKKSDSVPTLKDEPKVTPMEVSIEKTKAAPEQFSVEDLVFLIDFFYLPYNHGEKAEQIMTEFKWLKAHAVKDDSPEIEALPEEERENRLKEWTKRADAFHVTCQQVSDIFVKLSDIPNRALLYDIYPYIWDVKEVVLLLDAFITWLGSKSRKKKKKTPFYPDDPEPWVFRGGICGEMQRLLPIDGGHDLYSVRVPEVPASSVYTIRPFQPMDEQAVYEICLATCDDGQDGHDLFPSDPNMAGDRFVGPYLFICQENSFVVEDEFGLCGYAMATTDAKQFYDQYKEEWLPQMCKKYPKPTGNAEDWTYAEQVADSFHNPKIFLPEELYEKYKAHLCIDLLPRARVSGLGKRLLACVLSALKNEGCSGVYVELSATYRDALNFYSRMGFKNVPLSVTLPDDTIILGN